jgi:uncharacterized protein YbjQ (UPF0145 family)
MGFLDRILGGGDEQDKAAKDAAEADIARIEAGGIPLAAEQRIRELAQGGSAFTSNMSVTDFALSKLDGVRPICQVMGSSIYKVGWQNYPWGNFWGGGAVTELKQLSDAWNHARALALGRLEQEATLAGGHAVIDVNFAGNRHDFAEDAIEIVINGTAVHLPDERSGDERGTGDRPVLTDLSLPDYTLLRRGGYKPVGIVASTSVFYILASWQTQRATGGGWFGTQWSNQELVDFTQGVYAAREMAIARATSQAERLDAGGLVGMQIEHDVDIREVDQNNSKREDLIVTFHILGTAIAPAGDHVNIDPQFVLRQGAK